MKYTIKYKLPSQWFWRKIKNVIADSSITLFYNKDLPGSTPSHLLIITEDKTHTLVPKEALFVFSPERHYSIKGGMEKESGNKVCSTR